jgi:hypothetical protein
LIVAFRDFLTASNIKFLSMGMARFISSVSKGVSSGVPNLNAAISALVGGSMGIEGGARLFLCMAQIQEVIIHKWNAWQ